MTGGRQRKGRESCTRLAVRGVGWVAGTSVGGAEASPGGHWVDGRHCMRDRQPVVVVGVVGRVQGAVVEETRMGLG